MMHGNMTDVTDDDEWRFNVGIKSLNKFTMKAIQNKFR